MPAVGPSRDSGVKGSEERFVFDNWWPLTRLVLATGFTTCFLAVTLRRLFKFAMILLS